MWLISQVRSWWTFLEWQQNDWKNNCCPLLLNTSGVAVLCVFPTKGCDMTAGVSLFVWWGCWWYGLFLPCKLSDTPFHYLVQGLRCSVPHVPNDDIHTIPFFLKAGASVRCGFSVSFLRGWQLLWCVLPDVGNWDSCEVHRMKLVEWIRVRCNIVRIRMFHLSLPAQVIFSSRQSLYEVGCGSVVLPFVFRHMIKVHYCSSKGHRRYPFTKLHDPCPLKGGMWPTRMGDFRVPTSEGDCAVDQLNLFVGGLPWVTVERLEE